MSVFQVTDTRGERALVSIHDIACIKECKPSRQNYQAGCVIERMTSTYPIWCSLSYEDTLMLYNKAQANALIQPN